VFYMPRKGRAYPAVKLDSMERNMKKTFAALIVAFAASSAVPAFAAEQAAPAAAATSAAPAAHKAHYRHHKGHKQAEAAAVAAGVPFNKLPASTQGYIKAGAKMHREMMIDYTGNADIDFARAMLPHHKGAVSMAEIEMKYGKDAEMRGLAKQIITSQKQEIAQMTQWLKQKRLAAEEQAKAEKKAAAEQAKAAKKAAKEQAKPAK